MKAVLLLLILAISVSARECVEPSEGVDLTQSTTFCSNTYDLPTGLKIISSNIVLDCGTAVLRGSPGKSELGIWLENVDNVTVRNCNIVTFDQGIYLKNVTNSLIEDNAILKGRIGIRLLNAYENTIRDVYDKSFQLPVSAIASKYNLVMLGNKDLEREFCEVNACNAYRDMNICESDDFYCSKKCSPETDSDCKIVIREIADMENKSDNISAISSVSSIQQQVTLPEQKSIALSLQIKMLIYLLAYIVIFIVLIAKKRK